MGQSLNITYVTPITPLVTVRCSASRVVLLCVLYSCGTNLKDDALNSYLVITSLTHQLGFIVWVQEMRTGNNTWYEGSTSKPGVSTSSASSLQPDCDSERQLWTKGYSKMYTNALGFGAHLRPAHVSGSVCWGVERRSASPAGVLNSLTSGKTRQSKDDSRVSRGTHATVSPL